MVSQETKLPQGKPIRTRGLFRAARDAIKQHVLELLESQPEMALIAVWV